MLTAGSDGGGGRIVITALVIGGKGARIPKYTPERAHSESIDQLTSFHIRLQVRDHRLDSPTGSYLVKKMARSWSGHVDT